MSDYAAFLARLRAFCPRCHLAYDQEEHAATRARTRAAQLTEAGQLDLFSEAS